jgi:hypothetical protein
VQIEIGSVAVGKTPASALAYLRAVDQVGAAETSRALAIIGKDNGEPVALTFEWADGR